MLKSDGLQAGIHSHAICGCIVLAVASVVALMAAFIAIGDGDSTEEVYADGEWKLWDYNIKWKYDYSSNTLFVQSIDPTQEARIKDASTGSYSGPPWYGPYGGKCVKVCLSDDILYIGDCAFWNMQKISCLYVGDEETTAPSSGIQFPSRLQGIGSLAFSNCRSLTGMFTFPETMQEIKYSAFEKCSGITGSLVIPDSVTYLGAYAFLNCRFDGDICFGSGVKAIPDYLFGDCNPKGYLVFGAAIESVGVEAFDGCSNLVGEIDVSSMTSIGKKAFNGCSKLTGEMKLNPSLTALGDSAFEGCVGFTGSVKLQSLTEVQDNAFKGCSGLNGTITISRADRIGNGAFEGCSNITLLKMENTAIAALVIGDYAFAGCTSMRIEGDAGLRITNAESIGAYAFYNCSGLAGPLEITTRGYAEGGFSFAGCTGFTSAKLSTQVIEHDTATCTIPTHAFDNCTGLKELSFVENAGNIRYKISDYAFAGCTGITAALKVHVCLSSIGSNAFAGCTNILTIQFDYAKLESFATDAFPSHVFYKDGVPIPISKADYTAMYSGPDSLYLSAVPDNTPVCYPLFDIDGGSEPAPIMGQMARGVEFPLPGYLGQKEKARFSGWSYNGAVYQPGDKLIMGANDMAFKAVWTELVRHDVTYDLDGGSGTVPQQHGYEGDRIILMPYDGTKDSFTYLGWLYNGFLYQPADSITMPDADITVVAYWSSMPTHTVSYDIDGGSEAAPKSREMIEDTAFVLPDYEGVKAGFIFTGWLLGGKVYDVGDTLVMGDRDISIIARWTPVHSVFYDIAGGSGDVPDTEVVQEGEIFAVAECTAYKEGFRFHGWYDGSETFQPGDGIEMSISDITLTAVWRKGGPMHSVFYDANGGSEDVPIQEDVEEGHAFIIKMYGGTKEGYTFGGWSYDGKVYYTGDRVVMGTSDIKLTAVWNGRGIALDGDAIMIICAAAAGIAAACAIAFYIVRIHR